jgi:hypothetical protein
VRARFCPTTRKTVSEGEEAPATSYNLWQSENSRYTLGFTVRAQASATPAPFEQELNASAQPNAAEMERIDLLMEKPARQLEARPTA